MRASGLHQLLPVVDELKPCSCACYGTTSYTTSHTRAPGHVKLHS